MNQFAAQAGTAINHIAEKIKSAEVQQAHEQPRGVLGEALARLAGAQEEVGQQIAQLEPRMERLERLLTRIGGTKPGLPAEACENKPQLALIPPRHAIGQVHIASEAALAQASVLVAQTRHLDSLIDALEAAV